MKLSALAFAVLLTLVATAEAGQYEIRVPRHRRPVIRTIRIREAYPGQDRLKRRVAEAELRVAEAKLNFGTRSPEYRVAREDLRIARDRLRTENRLHSKRYRVGY